MIVTDEPVPDERIHASAVREHQRWRPQRTDMVRQKDRDLTELAWALRRLGMYKPELAQVLDLSPIQLDRVLDGKRA